MKRLLCLYLAFSRAHIMRILEYRSSFFIGIIAVAARHVVGVLSLWVIFTQVKSLGGWSSYEVVFLYGFVSLVSGLHHFFFLNTFRVEYMVQEATLDRYLVRPLPVLFQILLFYYDDDAIGDIVPAVLILAFAASKLAIEITFPTAMVFLAGTAGGVVIFFGIHLILSSWSFWFVKSRALIQLFSEVRRFSEYPLNIFSPAVQLILTIVIPIAFAGFYPAEGILNRSTISYLAWMSLPAGIVFLLIGYTVFRIGLTQYQSVGS